MWRSTVKRIRFAKGMSLWKGVLGRLGVTKRCAGVEKGYETLF